MVPGRRYIDRKVLRATPDRETDPLLARVLTPPRERPGLTHEADALRHDKRSFAAAVKLEYG
jgi:hypothetical protein